MSARLVHLGPHFLSKVPARPGRLAPVRATARLKPFMKDVLVPWRQTILSRWFVQKGEKVERIMRQIALLCAAISMAVFVSPASAQQTPPEQSAQPAQQTGPNEPASPSAQSMPEEAQPTSTSPTEPPPPPPFPPMPRARPSHRWVDLGSVHRSRSHHQSGRTHHQSARTHHRHSADRSRPAQVNSKMKRRCMRMSVREAMRQSACRSLMRDNLHASEARHHGSAHKHKKTTHRRRHQSKRR
jgi:hypothetical protein